MRPLNLTIEGMSCARCVARVQNVLARFDGLEIETLEVGRARVRTDGDVAEQAALLAALSAAGYPARIEVRS